MIIEHQDNITAFAGNHTWYWLNVPQSRIGVTPVAAYGSNEHLAQIRWRKPWNICIPHDQT
jgi:hypothetical protein